MARPSAEISMGEVTGTCDPSSVPVVLTTDGSGLAWRDAALSWIDGIAQANAEMVVDQLKQLMLVDGATSTVGGVASRTPGLDYAETSTSARTVAPQIDGDQVALAVRAQSGTCYLVAGQISTNTELRYGFGDDCTPAGARSDATLDRFPDAG